jgi:tRNA nucleotidyltransferase (CCA-adding enzyme)
VGLQKMFTEIGLENSDALGKILDYLAKHKSIFNSQEAEVIMFSGLLSLPGAKPVDFLKKWIPVNILLKKVPALLDSLSLFNINNKNDLRRCALKANGLKLPAMLKSAIKNDVEIYNLAQAIGKEMNIWEAAPEPFITGQMLLDMGLKPGPELGKIIKQIFELQLDGQVKSKEEAISKIYLYRG